MDEKNYKITLADGTELSNLTMNGQSWFVLRDMTPKELEQAKIKSDIEYLAMMCDVDL